MSVARRTNDDHQLPLPLQPAPRHDRARADPTDGYVEPTLLTAADNAAEVHRFVRDGASGYATDVIAALLDTTSAGTTPGRSEG